MNPEHSAEIDAGLHDLTDDEIEAVDQWMNDHMYHHSISNSYAAFACDSVCRKRALADAFRRFVLLPRRDATRPTPPGETAP